MFCSGNLQITIKYDKIYIFFYGANVMVLNYYPGCTLKSKVSQLDISARAAAKALGVELCEIPEWQCCGGVYPVGQDETGQRLPAVRALYQAKNDTGSIVTVCSACHHVLKRANHDMRSDVTIREKVNAYLEYAVSYNGETQVIHYLEMLRDKVGFDVIGSKVKKSLKNMNIASYYGCLLLRPSKVMEFDDAENPCIMENFVTALGANPVIFPFRNECCGGYAGVNDSSFVEKRSKTVVESAKAHGADMIITACPLCMYNLKKYSDIPVKFFTELLCEALEIEVTQSE